MGEGCNSRPLSRLMKSCFPNPQDPLILSPSLLPRTTASSSLSSLPDDLLLYIFSLLPLSSLPSLSLVSPRWSLLLSSPSFLSLLPLQPTLFSLSLSLSSSSFSLLSFSLPLSLPSSWNTSTASLSNDPVLSRVDLPSLFSHSRAVALGRWVYILGRNGTVQYDCWGGSLKVKREMGFPRKKFAAAVVGGRIYVAGGASRTSAVEEYDPVQDRWRVVSDAPRRRYGCVGVGVDGVFYVIGGLKIGATLDPSRAGSDVSAYVSSMDLYDVEARGWLRPRTVPGGGCVVGACGTKRHVYVLTSHAVEYSFWRFQARRKAGGGGVVGEWCRMKNPPMPRRVRVDGTVRLRCVAAEEKVVVVVVVVSGRGERERVVLVFDCESEEWSRGPDLPEVVTRAAFVCVQC